MSSEADARAAAKAIGEDVELLVAQQLEDVQLVPDDTVDWYDGVATSCLWPNQPAIFGGICVIERSTPIEIKACQVQASMGDRSHQGVWLFKGRDRGQHQRLVDHDGVYALAVHREADAYLGREVVGLILVPAATIDDHLRGRWYDSGRREGQISQLAWPALLDRDELLVGGDL